MNTPPAERVVSGSPQDGGAGSSRGLVPKARHSKAQDASPGKGHEPGSALKGRHRSCAAKTCAALSGLFVGDHPPRACALGSAVSPILGWLHSRCVA